MKIFLLLYHCENITTKKSQCEIPTVFLLLWLRWKNFTSSPPNLAKLGRLASDLPPSRALALTVRVSQ